MNIEEGPYPVPSAVEVVKPRLPQRCSSHSLNSVAVNLGGKDCCTQSYCSFQDSREALLQVGLVHTLFMPTCTVIATYMYHSTVHLEGRIEHIQ